MVMLCWPCNVKRKEIQDQMRPATTVRYKAIPETDTGWLAIDTAGQKLIGLLSFHYQGGKKYLGQFKGEMRGTRWMVTLILGPGAMAIGIGTQFCF